MEHNQFQSHHSAHAAMRNYILTTNEQLKSDPTYRKVADLIFRLVQAGVTQAGKGYCISMSDVVYTLLKQNNIPCRIVECSLTVTNKVANQIWVMGYDGLKEADNKADSHVVVVTETDIPMIIDISIAHLLPNNVQGVIDVLLDTSDDGIFVNIDHPMVALTYKYQNKFTVPMLHQQSIVDRIRTDVKMLNSIKTLKVMIVIALSVSLLNASRGFYDFYSVYILDNYWGPRAIKYISDKVDRLDSKLDKIVK